MQAAVKSVSKRLGAILCILLLTGLAALLLPVALRSYHTSLTQDDRPFVEGWRTREGQVITLPCHLPDREKEQPVYLTNTLPQDLTGRDVLLFRTSHQRLRVYLDGQAVYEYGMGEDGLFSKSPGSSWHFIRLTQEAAGKTITLELISPYRRYAGMINEAYLGNEGAHWHALFQEGGTGAFIGLLMILGGVLSILCLGFFSWRRGKGLAGLFLALFVVLTGVWMLGESKLVQLFYNAPLLIYLATLAANFAMPIPLGLFLLHHYRQLRRAWLIKLETAAHAVFFAAAMLLQITATADFMELLLFFQALLAVSIFSAFFVFASQARTLAKPRTILLALTVLLAGGAADLAAFNLDPLRQVSQFTQMGVVVFIILLLIEAGRSASAYTYMRATNDVLRKMARKDSLTGLHNRTAYEEAVQKLRQSGAVEQMALAVLDIDGLKAVNDGMGHQAGDRLISAGAGCINKTLGRAGIVYRIGGDEFVALFTGVPPERLKDLLQELEGAVQAFNESGALFVLSLSAGCAVGTGQEDYDALFRRADQAMYRQKEEKRRKTVRTGCAGDAGNAGDTGEKKDFLPQEPQKE